MGEAAPAREWHDRACAAAPDDAIIAAARILDAPWLDGGATDGLTADWLKRFVRPGKPRHWRPAGDKITIAYLVSRFADPHDAAAVAAVARAHVRSGAVVIGYGLGAQSWDENAVLGGAFDKWRDITGLDPATLARTITVDGAAVVVDCAGFAAPGHLLTLARIPGAVRVGWHGQAAGLGQAVYDAVIAPAGQHDPEAEVWDGGCGGYPLMRDWSRPRQRIADAALRFGSDAYLRQIDARSVELWLAALEAVPGSVLLLRANDMASTQNIARLVGRFGEGAAARVDVIDAAADDFYRQVDVALAPVTGWSARMAAEALACGVPMVALDSAGPYGAWLRDVGLSDFVAATPGAYVERASAVAQSSDELSLARAAAEAVAECGAGTAAAIAAAIEQSARTMLAKASA